MILAYILIVLIIAFVVYLWLELKKVKNNQLTLTEKENGEVVLEYKKEEVINYQLHKK